MDLFYTPNNKKKDIFNDDLFPYTGIIDKYYEMGFANFLPYQNTWLPKIKN